MPHTGALELLAKWLENEEAYRRIAESDNVIRCDQPASPDLEEDCTPLKQTGKNYMLEQYVATPTSSHRCIRRRRLNFRDPAFIYELEDISDEEVEDMVFNWVHEFPRYEEHCEDTQAKFAPTMDGEETCMEFPRRLETEYLYTS